MSPYPVVVYRRVFAVAAVLAAAGPGCLDAPMEPSPPVARLVVGWDPLACGDPHRVVVELTEDAGAVRSASAPCGLGGVAVDLAHFGIYRGRIYAWALAAPIRSIAPLEVTIEQPITDWRVATPR
jgi:hypothetical protein